MGRCPNGVGHDGIDRQAKPVALDRRTTPVTPDLFGGLKMSQKWLYMAITT